MVSRRPDRLALQELHGYVWGVLALLLLSLAYAVLQIGYVRPFLWPAGTGALLEGDPSAALPLMARPPNVSGRVPNAGDAARVSGVAPASPAAREGIRVGDVVVNERGDDGQEVDLSSLASASPAGRLAAWRDMYRLGVSGPVEWTMRDARHVRLERLPAWSAAARRAWALRHLGMLVQIVVFTGAALMLLMLRSTDRTAALSVLALALSAVGGGGPLFGVERSIPIAGPILTIFTWTAGAFAFPIIALAILYFPSPSRLLVGRPWLHAIPFVVASPMLALSLMTALYLTGVEAAAGAALYDASHPGIYGVSFAAALILNLLVIGEGVHRYRTNRDANERRRIRMAIYTAVPGVVAYAIKDGVPVVARLAGFAPPVYHASTIIGLQAFVLMPAFGLVYAVGVARVLGPRVVLRRSLQYALASRTLTVIAVLPALALGVSLARSRDVTIGAFVSGQSGILLLLVAASVATYRYRERARRWLDERFFRREYDARKILLSLASRVRFETDPADLAAMVVTQIDEALHPESTAILVTGVDEGRLTPVSVLHGAADSLPLDGGLVSMLRWSDEPLEVFLNDPRSPARRLPPEELEWLECTATTLLVPVVGQDRSLIAVIALAEKRSEEAYSDEDRQLLASIASQMGLGFDVARLRRTASLPSAITTRAAEPPPEPMMECPRCGRCEEAATTLCPSDGTPMTAVATVPRVVDNKYRIEQLLGRGGMGAVYRARDMRLDRLIALKVVRAELLGDPEARQRFRREAQIVARLQHPSIVSVFDYGTFFDGGAYLVMELVRGEDLRRVLQREGRLEVTRALPILSTVCAAIDAAHREGVLHRDLKPENILLPGGEIAAKVLDFGVAKVIGEERREAETLSGSASTLMTAPGTLMGTPAYMAPEQFHGEPPDARTDVFSLAVIAYEMLSGDLPFGRSLADVVIAQQRGARPMGGPVPGALDRVVRAALDAERDRRPRSPMEFAELLAAAGTGA